MTDYNATSASNARHRRRHREAGADMMETDVDSGSSHMTHRTGTSGQATTGLGAGQNEIRLEKAREFLNMVKVVAAKQPEIEKEFDALEMMVSRSASMESEVELKARINELEKQLAELQEEHSQLKAAKGTSDSKHGAHRHDNNMSFEKENYDGKLKATESLNHQLKEEVMKLQLQNRDAIQKLDKCKKNLSLADDGIQNERKAKEDSQEKVRTLNEMLDRHKNAYTKVTHEKNELRHQVQESNEKVEALEQVKQQLAKLVEVKDSALQEKREDLEAIRKELDETKSRLSKMMGNQMKDGNPYIADLSDKNRPTKVADTYSELYDNEWTDAFDVLQTTAYRKEEKDIARQLLDILMDINTFCKQEAERQTTRIKQSLLVDDLGCKLQPSTHQELKQFQRSTADSSLQGVFKKYVDPNRTRSLTVTANASKVPEFVKKCIDVCWIMAVQDPPLELKTESQSFDSFNKDEYKAYTKLGQYIDFVVWPPLLLHKEGPLLAKGVAQGWGTQQGGMKSPDARNKEVPFPKEPKQAWSTTTNQTRSYPSTSAGFTYSQSPVVPTSAYPASTVACTQYEQTTVTPTSYHGTAVPMAHNQSLSPSVTDARAQSQRLTAAQAQLATYNMQNLALNQNQNTGLSYPPRQTDLLTGGNVTQQNYESQMTYGSQSSQSGANPYMYHYMYQNNQ